MLCCSDILSNQYNIGNNTLRPNSNCVSRECKKERKDLSLPAYFEGLLSQILKATPQFPSPSLASSSIPLFSSVDHGKLISICFTVISHNSSIAAAVPAYWARLPQRQLSLSASRHRLAALALHTLHGLVGFSVCCIQTLNSAATKVLCPHPAPEYVVIFYTCSCLWSACYTAGSRCSS